MTIVPTFLGHLGSEEAREAGCFWPFTFLYKFLLVSPSMLPQYRHTLSQERACWDVNWDCVKYTDQFGKVDVFKLLSSPVNEHSMFLGLFSYVFLVIWYFWPCYKWYHLKIFILNYIQNFIRHWYIEIRLSFIYKLLFIVSNMHKVYTFFNFYILNSVM